MSAVPAAAPVFNPASGKYATAQTITLSDATPGAVIYYTTDGTQPTSGSAVYQSPITVSTSQVLQAIAVVRAHPLALWLPPSTPSSDRGHSYGTVDLDRRKPAEGRAGCVWHDGRAGRRRIFPALD